MADANRTWLITTTFSFCLRTRFVSGVACISSAVFKYTLPRLRNCFWCSKIVLFPIHRQFCQKYMLRQIRQSSYFLPLQVIRGLLCVQRGGARRDTLDLSRHCINVTYKKPRRAEACTICGRVYTAHLNTVSAARCSVKPHLTPSVHCKLLSEVC